MVCQAIQAQKDTPDAPWLLEKRVTLAYKAHTVVPDPTVQKAFQVNRLFFYNMYSLIRN